VRVRCSWELVWWWLVMLVVFCGYDISLEFELFMKCVDVVLYVVKVVGCN